METSKVVFICFFLTYFTVSSATPTNLIDFCVADLELPIGPAGYPCRDQANLTANDFVFSGFRIPENASIDDIFKNNVTRANSTTFPALNGLGLSMSRLDVAVGGAIPVHTHRVSELIIVIDGPLIAGFIANDNTVYYKTLHNYEIMIFPATLLHFQVNPGKKPALAFVSLNSDDGGAQITSESLFGNYLPTHSVSNITLLDATEVKRMKNIFGGTN